MVEPWHDKQTHKTFIRPDSGKCLHYYFYFLDAAFGLIYLRVPTWCPFRLQFYCNGHNWLAAKLAAEGIGYTMADNAFVRINDWPRAQVLADSLSPDQLHRTLDHYAARCCPVSEVFGQSFQGPSQDWGCGRRRGISRLIFDQGWTRGLDHKVGGNRG